MVMRKIVRNSVIVLCLLLLAFAASAGKLLVVDDPKPSDVILVLAGETDRRPARGLELLDKGFAPRMVIDVPVSEIFFGFSEEELAEKYVAQLPEAGKVRICRIVGLSTRDESHDIGNCLADEKADRILIVTSDYHTRRALSILRHELPGKSFSIAAAYDPAQYGTLWWTHRQWAKTFFDEWLRVIWWNAVDRWR
jgi:hypothetical protein